MRQWCLLLVAASVQFLAPVAALPCDSFPCMNGGSCTNGAGTYTCACVSGYSGELCQTDIDECASSPCYGNAQDCIDNVNGFTCLCFDGWGGDFCQTDIDECASSPCMNGGTCQDQDGYYTCTCAFGWVGESCELNTCDHAPFHRFLRPGSVGLGGPDPIVLADNYIIVPNNGGGSDPAGVVITKTNATNALVEAAYGPQEVDVFIPGSSIAASGTSLIIKYLSAMQVYHRNGTEWQLIETIASPDPAYTFYPILINDHFIVSLGVAGGFNARVHTWKRNATAPTEPATHIGVFLAPTQAPVLRASAITPSECQNQSFTIGGQGGHYWVYDWNGTAWNQHAYMQPCSTSIVTSVSFTCTDLIGAASASSCVFRSTRTTGAFLDPEVIMTAGMYGANLVENCGRSVAVIPDALVVGCPDGVVSGVGSGRVLVWTGNSTTWATTAPVQLYLACSAWAEPNAQTSFGYDVAVLGTRIAVSDPGALGGAGAVYQFSLPCSPSLNCTHGRTCLSPLPLDTVTPSKCACTFPVNFTDAPCTVCDRGTFQPDDSPALCSSCAINHFSNWTDVSSCQACDFGHTYQPATGATSCIACVPGANGCGADECASRPCQNGGSCVGGIGAYTCTCADGYSGNLCQTAIDECASAPCAHGGTCQDAVASFTCTCTPEWMGATCQLSSGCGHSPFHRILRQGSINFGGPDPLVITDNHIFIPNTGDGGSDPSGVAITMTNATTALVEAAYGPQEVDVFIPGTNFAATDTSLINNYLGAMQVYHHINDTEWLLIETILKPDGYDSFIPVLINDHFIVAFTVLGNDFPDARVYTWKRNQTAPTESVTYIGVMTLPTNNPVARASSITPSACRNQSFVVTRTGTGNTQADPSPVGSYWVYEWSGTGWIRHDYIQPCNAADVQSTYLTCTSLVGACRRPIACFVPSETMQPARFWHRKRFDGRRSRSCERRVVWHFRCRHSRDTRGRLPRRRRGQWRDGSCTRLVGKLDDVGRLGASRIADDVLRMGTIGVGSSVRIQCRRVRVAYRRFRIRMLQEQCISSVYPVH
jgi:hypothetical protein